MVADVRKGVKGIDIGIRRIAQLFIRARCQSELLNLPVATPDIRRRTSHPSSHRLLILTLPILFAGGNPRCTGKGFFRNGRIRYVSL